MIVLANGAPILARVFLKENFSAPLDLGHKLPDRRRVFGDSKTWRGVISACVVTSMGAWILGYSFDTGLLVAVYAVLGDLASSFIKRRLGKPVSSMALFLDQVPESLFPAFMMMETFKLDLSDIMLLVFIFIIGELFFSRILYKWGVRKHPY